MINNVTVVALSDDELEINWSGADIAKVIAVGVEGSTADVCLMGEQSKARLTLSRPAVQPVFSLLCDSGEEYRVAQRRISLDGSHNFRDMGGYITQEGKQVRWGSLYRSGRLSALTQDDVARIRDLDIGLVCDFRRPAEVDAHPSILPDNSPLVMALSIDPGSLESFFDKIVNREVVPEQVAEFMGDINNALVLSYAHRYREMFEQLLTMDNRSVLIHCTAGKDRTGFGAKLLLSALGVDRATIMQDYLLTNDYLPIDQEIAALQSLYFDRKATTIDPQLLRPILEVRAEYLRRAFSAIDERYGSVMNYLLGPIGLSHSDIATLKARYLY